MAKPSLYRNLIKNTAFRALWMNQILVQLAYNTVNFTLIIWVFKLMDSNLAVSALMLAIYSPSLVFGLFSGSLVDILDKRKIILFIDFLLAANFLVFIFIKNNYLLILANTFLINSLSQFFMPSESSSIPLLVNKSEWLAANSLFSLTLFASVMLGSSAAGPILNHFGINSIFILAAILLFIAFILSQNLPSIKVKKMPQSVADLVNKPTLARLLRLVISESKLTVKFVKGKISVATAIILLSGVQVVIGMMAVMLPVYMEKVLKIHATDSSYFAVIPFGLGVILAIVAVARYFHNTPRRFIVVPAVIGVGLMFMLIGFLPAIAKILISADLPDYIVRPRYFFRAPSLSFFFGVVAFILGICSAAIILPCQTILQEQTPEQSRGKIFAVLAAMMTAFSALPVIFAGVLSDFLGVRPVFIGLGVLILLLGFLVRSPSIFFGKDVLPFSLREFLGLGHWKR